MVSKIRHMFPFTKVCPTRTLSILLSLYLALAPSLALAQSAVIATPVPNAKQTFLDANGNPLAGGKVWMYVPNTTTPKTTWQDTSQLVPNTNPVTLDSAGRAIIMGQGNYQQRVLDSAGNLQWNAFTISPGSAAPSGATGTDTAPVGTLMPFAGFTLPLNWALAYGQTFSRASFPELLDALTIVNSTVSCTATSVTLSGFASTNMMRVGAPIEAACLSTGTTIATIAGPTSVTVSSPANVTITTPARVFPWGNGDGTLTFTAPDMRGRIIAGPNAMGGVAASTLTSTYYGSNPDAPGVNGGSQSHTLSVGEMPTHSHTITTLPHTHDTNFSIVAVDTGGGQALAGSGGAVTVGTTSVTVNATAANTGGGSAHSIVQPTTTVNYMIKTKPNSSGLGGVVSIGGMFGDILCGSNLTCANQTIDFSPASASAATIYANVSSSAGAPSFVSPPSLTNLVAPNASLDYLVIWDNATNTLKKVTPGAIATSSVAGVASLGGLTGIITCGSGLSCSAGTVSVTSPVVGEAMTRVDDTNVTLTLGGTPATSLLAATSLTLGWTGSLSVPRGGTGATSFTANAPLFGNGTGALLPGTRSGNTTSVATTSGALTSGNCVATDANGNFVSAAGPCSISGGGLGNAFCNLKDAMDTFYGAGLWTYYTTVGTGTDIGPAVSACITTFAGLRSRGIIWVPATGPFALKTSSIDFSGVYVEGEGSQASIIIYQPAAPSVNAFTWKGTGGATGGGMRGIGLLLETGLGDTTNGALQFKGDATHQPDQTELNDLYITALAGSTWSFGLVYDGLARTSPQGVRIAQISNVQLFANNAVGAYFGNAVQFSISNLGVYTGSGAGQSVYIAGGGTGTTNTTQIILDNVSAAADVNVTNVSKFFIRGWGNTVSVGTSATHGIIQMNATPVGTCGTGCTVTTF